jgi:putative transposase
MIAAFCAPDGPGAHLSLERVCFLLGVNRGSLYRYRTGLQPAASESRRVLRRRQLVELIEEIVLEFPRYGYRRVTAELRRRGRCVSRKLVHRLMREESLLCRLRRRWIATTRSDHDLPVYPNLLPDCGWRTLARVNQAWVADLTYIRLPQGFVYLAAILDAFSRKVVGWQLGQEISGRLVLQALEQALQERQPPAGWIHHSDRGVQYASRAYVERLRRAGAQISMTALASPRENAQAESFFRTLKHEEVYLADYQTYEEAERSLRRFIDDVYNAKRLHSSLDYRPPNEFEALTGGLS